ncbi:MAG: NAD(P)/FAD-dependent oxidoreductase [Christensenellales bacterium]
MEATKNKKIFVLGAGLGGLLAAYKLGTAGFDVTVFEKEAKANLGYPWHDSVKPDTFSDVKLMPPKTALLKKQRLCFYCLQSDNFVKQGNKAEKSFDVDRKILLDYMLSLAESCCTVNYSTPPDSLLIENETVCGIILNGKKMYADLVIDSSGCQSPFRKDVPKKFMIESDINPDDFMKGYRAFFNKQSPSSKAISNVYLKADGKNSVAWCKDAPKTDSMDVFIGKLTSLTDDEIGSFLKELRRKNPALGENLIFGQKVTLTVRYPLSVFVADGYALCGDSAFMEMPMVGSGIESALKAGYYLANTVLSPFCTDFSAKELWEYEVKFMRNLGSNFIAADYLKRWAMGLSDEELNWVYSSGLITENLSAIENADGEKINLNLLKESNPNFFKKAGIALKRKDILNKTVKALNTAAQAKITAMLIPPVYKPSNIAKWAKKYNSFIYPSGDDKTVD